MRQRDKRYRFGDESCVGLSSRPWLDAARGAELPALLLPALALECQASSIPSCSTCMAVFLASCSSLAASRGSAPWRPSYPCGRAPWSPLALADAGLLPAFAAPFQSWPQLRGLSSCRAAMKWPTEASPSAAERLARSCRSRAPSGSPALLSSFLRRGRVGYRSKTSSPMICRSGGLQTFGAKSRRVAPVATHRPLK
jgi:hypothetical protein